MDAIDLESVPNQIGTGIIRINDQTILKVIIILNSTEKTLYWISFS